jgi:cell division protein FtsL
MTPSAMTSAGRKVATARTEARTAGVRAGAAPGRASSSVAPRTARAAAALRPVRAAAAPRPVRAAAAPRPARVPAPRQPRRVSGPVKRRRPDPQLPLSRRLALGTVEFIRTLPDHRLLDRLVRGRAWIPVLGVLLAGIVATQVEVLKLGASMGRWIERSAALTSHNQALQASVATLSDDQRIERVAAHMGMAMPAPTSITFLSPHPAGGAAAAVKRIQAPDTGQFLTTLQADGDLTTTAFTSSGPGPAPAGTTYSSSAAASSTVSTSAGASAAVTPPGTTSSTTGG